MEALVATLFTDDVGIGILPIVDHKIEIEHEIKSIEDKLEHSDDDEELCYKLDCLYKHLSDPTVWITGDMVDGEDEDNRYPSESDSQSDVDCVYDSD